MHPNNQDDKENGFTALLGDLVLEIITRIYGPGQLIAPVAITANLRSAPTYTILLRQRTDQQQALWNTILERAKTIDAQRGEIEELTKRLKDRGTVITTLQALLLDTQGQRDALAGQVRAADSALLSVAKIALASIPATI